MEWFSICGHVWVSVHTHLLCRQKPEWDRELPELSFYLNHLKTLHPLSASETKPVVSKPQPCS